MIKKSRYILVNSHTIHRRCTFVSLQYKSQAMNDRQPLDGNNHDSTISDGKEFNLGKEFEEWNI